jgi:2-oxoglutarate/2-oxoacid ferredoxin oxidoreductase subunit beta
MQNVPYETYLVDGVTFPFCRGCGHTHSVRHLDKALTILQREPSSINLVSDIGCIGLVDALFSDIHTVHTTHGRSTAFATGIEIADSLLHESDLKTIVILGDGGATIGLLHIVTAALMNVDLTVIVANNYIYGMTGGQHSGFTPFDMVTTTTPSGNTVAPMDICRVAESCDAGFVARMIATDRELPGVLAKAIEHPGFALVEILELCPEYGLKYGGIDGKKLKETVREQKKELGILVRRNDREEFSQRYARGSDGNGPVREKKDGFLKREFSAALDEPRGIVIAGTAGERVQLSSYLLLNAAIASGLHATQKNDNPVTQGSGFSLSEVLISPDEIHYTGIEVPDFIVITSNDGLKEILANGVYKRAGTNTLLVADETIPVPETSGTIVSLPLRKMFGADRAAVAAVGLCILLSGIIPREAYEREIRKRYGDESAKIMSGIGELAAGNKLLKKT